MHSENLIALFVFLPFCLLTGWYCLKHKYFQANTNNKISINFKHLVTFFFSLFFINNYSLKILAWFFPSLYKNHSLEQGCSEGILLIFFFLFLAYLKQEKLTSYLYFKKKYIKDGFFTLFLIFPWLAFISLVTNFFLDDVLHLAAFQQTNYKLLEEETLYLPLLCTGAFATIVISPFIEEMIFRVGLQNFLSEKCNTSIALFVTPLLFVTMHLDRDQGLSNGYFALPAFTLSLGLSLLYHKTRSIYACLALHGSFNSLAVLRLLFQTSST